MSLPEPSYSPRVRRLAEWLYDRDLVEWNSDPDLVPNPPWQDATPETKEEYLSAAGAALRIVDSTEDKTGAM